jgi:hypothetical protein
MSRVEEIEQAILELSDEDFDRIARRVHEREQQRWDAEMDADAASGRLDFLVTEADDEARNGALRDWPV